MTELTRLLPPIKPTGYSPEAIKAAVAASADSIIVHNSLTRPEGYSPYCMRCPGYDRMHQISLLFWRHKCGAVHDEVEARTILLAYQEQPNADA